MYCDRISALVVFRYCIPQYLTVLLCCPGRLFLIHSHIVSKYQWVVSNRKHCTIICFVQCVGTRIASDIISDKSVKALFYVGVVAFLADDTPCDFSKLIFERK